MDSPKWFVELDVRQQKEVLFAVEYASKYSHGTDGHHRLMLIAKLADLLTEVIPGVLKAPKEYMD